MTKVVTVRLPGADVKLVEQLAKWEEKDKSTAIRELVAYGKI
ncbi:ribbon-helix-helix protein, CopG family, partial [Candidatus Woesearchaeota archaeon]|nr:ribbon-helix-helix protein, CopG family [Candidatus Woesearchaeota archaeon]